ncbi:hypothetical protein ASPWEDRAFT_35939 [Aspergillus wentii DTO 134E9]|uniref:Uncharacterized protein n=1 Tax=Aspergillus wentii DTO 134E9 TaxID=1073089 RepID=A0A1L9RTS4_ASPWE|nr:uncharacterized protein ASPWEDRAFT_35939 [Aspergillus wentii DTO 134E9]KAI9933966.1 hypothetical protein MW887_005038 [Aspergillus wentii]OJJ38330.1 hypothetical protein ASPWEDRAFT_35939 [Aspergillus wentii DTO 134E9]
MPSSHQGVNLPGGKNSQPLSFTNPQRVTSSRASDNQSNIPRGSVRGTTYVSLQSTKPDVPQQPIPRKTIPCLYHDPILRLEALNGQRSHSVMERYMTHNPSEQYALFHDRNGKLSTYRRCTCIISVDADFNRSGIGADEYKDLDRNNLSGFNFGL